ncbi:conserved hypothetical protein [Ricinus communis]|uniref:Mitochondrial transcription termination factor n=1 Tax=Ricinus communis TaxID=3988 RepID=B9SHV1_RICCO|nr:conserved hypothetical protein [Ricinus communis]
MANNQIRNLLSHIQKRFFISSVTLSSTPLSATSSSSFTVHYLLKSCGLPLESAISVSEKLQLDAKNQQRTQSVVDLLKSHNFSDTQLVKLIEKRPAVLQCKAQENIQPKFEYLIKQGFKAAIRRSSWLLTFDLKGTMQPNVEFLLKEGVPAYGIEKMILLQPRAIMQKHDRMVYAVNAVKNLGLEPKSRMFIHAVRVIISMSELTWKKKFEMMKSMGWNEEEILSAFKRDPLCLACSEEKIKNAMDFYLNTMKLKPHVIIAYPKFLMYAIDTRLRPRYNVLKVLESKKLIEGDKKIEWLLTINEKTFLQQYVIKYVDKVPEGHLSIFFH